MAEKTHDPQSRDSANKPNVVIFVSDGTLLTGFPDSVASRESIHVPISGPEMPFPAMATTIATGVHPMTHGIVTFPEIDEETLKAIAKTAGGRYFRARDKDMLTEIYQQINDMERTEIEVKSYTR